MNIQKLKAILITLIGLAIVIPLLLLSSGSAITQWGRQIYRADSLYNTIFVYERGSIVTLRFGRRNTVPIQSQVNKRNLKVHTLEYTKMMFCGLLYQPEPERVLVLGLGGGVIPRQMRDYYPEAYIDVVEIDKAIPPIAEKYFSFKPDEKMKVHVDDGRMFVKKRLRDKEADKYDIVILDAFNGDYIPFHMMTREFLEEVSGMLADDGVVVANVFSNSQLFDAEYQTFSEVFKQCQVYLGQESTNAMITAFGPEGCLLGKREAVEKARQIQKDIQPSFSLIKVAARLEEKLRPDPEAMILTDDRAPVNWLKEQERKP